MKFQYVVRCSEIDGIVDHGEENGEKIYRRTAAIRASLYDENTTGCDIDDGSCNVIIRCCGKWCFYWLFHAAFYVDRF